MADNKKDSAPQELYDTDDTLSFCEFAVYNDDYDNCSSPRKCPDTPDSLFEFFIDHDFEPDSSAVDPRLNPIVFCGKTISDPNPKQPKLVQRDPRNGLFLFKTNSFKRSQSVRSSGDLAKSLVLFKPKMPATGSCRYQSVGSRKYKMALIGALVKPQPRMELSDIKRRQSRRSPKPLFPVAEVSEPAAIVAVAADGGRAHKSLLRPLRCRAHLVSALVKASFGCIPSPRPV